ncbi:hypothetical protein M409DRAFT_64673 [Zasmidium cellare ATCC 36951]|uniref:rhomboid protease n=1 Tax=Zasmidium cellare ATCC 36951 TaxID=1080233 RepID=A0A6A6CQL4_ZASCE|nr:uncharacterized protein M409DRAFT_64673 [Zasmidium cellare ATCC 36951]KAF2169587.1 hypothetical protein M409DRAFT_64673 [Zasmidium cellare ATCC 36951]
MAYSFLQSLPDARRIRSSLLRLPLCTRGLVAVITLLYVVHWFVPEITEWGALIPSEINLRTLHRLNTFPLLHRDIFHYLLNIIALTPLLDRFESEHGTIVTFILFTGPFGLLPGGLYTLLERFVFHLDGHAVGSSVWVFLLLSSESIKTYRENPYFQISDFKIPTWTTPILLILVINFLVPHTSLLGHLCGALVGFLWGLGYIKFLAPPDKILRWIEGKLNLLGRLPHYVSVDQKTFGRYGVLPSTGGGRVGPGRGTLGAANGVAVGPLGSTQRLGP